MSPENVERGRRLRLASKMLAEVSGRLLVRL